MAIDFPNSPTTGQIFTATNGTSWQWTGTVWVAAGTATGLITGAPNKLINPFMEIDQANEGATVTSGYVVDGLIASIIAASSNAQRVTDAPAGYPNSVRVTITASHTVVAADGVSLQYRIEAEELADTRFGTSSAQTLTLAFWVKSSVAGTYGASLRNAAANRTYAFPVVITAANTWQYISEVISGDTAGTWVTSGNAVGAYLDITIFAGSNYQGTAPHAWAAGSFTATTGISNTIATTVGATFQLGPSGLWVAPAAQPLVRTSFQAELARCQRYYEKSYAPGTKPGTASSVNSFSAYLPAVTANAQTWNVPCQVTKRAAPTATTYSSNSGASGVIYNSTSSTDIAVTALTGLTNGVSVFTGSSNTVAWTFHWTLDARL